MAYRGGTGLIEVAGLQPQISKKPLRYPRMVNKFKNGLSLLMGVFAVR